MVERDATLARSLQATAARLGASAVDVVATDALAWLRKPDASPFDIVFIDPPFGTDLYRSCFELLPRWLAPGALVYVESARERVPQAPPDWQLHRQGETRDVRYALYRGGPSAPATLGSDSAT